MEEVEAVPGHYKNENPLHATLKPDEDPEMETREFTTEDGKKGLYFLFKYLDKEFPHFAYIDFEMNFVPDDTENTYVTGDIQEDATNIKDTNSNSVLLYVICGGVVTVLAGLGIATAVVIVNKKKNGGEK